MSFQTKRVTVPAVEEILGKEFKCLDKGFVRLVDYMGADSAIAQAARVSYGDGTKSVREDSALIEYLLSNEHTSPFEMVETKWHIKLPIFIARQWIRHRTANVNEISGRYSVIKNEFYVPDASATAFQSKDNKQGRGEEVSVELYKKVLQVLTENQQKSSNSYHQLLDENIAKELARINLPLSTYTEWYWKIDLHNLFHFLKLRMHPHAQQEIREYANTMLGITEKLVPSAVASFRKYVLDDVRTNELERNGIRRVIKGENLEAVANELFPDRKTPRIAFKLKAEKFL
jgi:thymidylate synthase (FAD)